MYLFGGHITGLDNFALPGKIEGRRIRGRRILWTDSLQNFFKKRSERIGSGRRGAETFSGQSQVEVPWSSDQIS